MGLFDFIKNIFIPEEEKYNPNSKMLTGSIPNCYVVFDIETTGFSRHDDRIIEIAANEYTNGHLTNHFHAYVNPGRHIPNLITRLTGIKDSTVSNAPTILQVKHDLLRFFGTKPLVGHNISTFDIPFLEVQFGCEIRNRTIDTLHLARESFPGLPNYKLVTLDYVLGLGGGEHHRAETDIAVNNALFHACANPKTYKKRIKDPAILNSIPIDTKAALHEKIDIHSIVPTDPEQIPHTALTGHGIVFSGEFSNLPEEMYQIAVDAGAILKTSVSRKVTYLVQGYVEPRYLDENGMSSKQRTAIKLQGEGHCVKIITEKEFLELAK